jgi:type III restriction enzyme
MIRETIREHLRKELQLRDKGIKVLSLFFVDKVASYMGEGATNLDANGDFAKWFDELFLEETAKNPKWSELFTAHPSQMRKAYFSQLKRGKTTVAQDTSGSTKADDDAYELIMKDKQRLLDQNEPVRFIFSHSALRKNVDARSPHCDCTTSGSLRNHRRYPELARDTGSNHRTVDTLSAPYLRLTSHSGKL